MLTMVVVFGLQLVGLVRWQHFAFIPIQLWHFWPGPGPLHGIAGLFAHQFLHGSLLHIIANLIALRVFGDNIEDALGHGRYAAFFLVSGALAAIAQGIAAPTAPLIGASGAISAVMSDDPREGVVDRDCRVHGFDNLYVAGSAVYPTTGYVNPTLTVVALALRLADHLKTKFRLA